MNLTLNIEDEVITLNKYGITPNELLIIRSILLLQNENQEELFHEVLSTLKRLDLSLRDILISLQKKQIITQQYKIPCEGCEFDPYAITLNKNFVKGLFKASFELGKELYDAYPQFGSVNGTLVSLRSVSKKFDSLEDAYFKYGKAIGFSPERHNQILELIQWAKDQGNIINFTLASFIVDRRWGDLESLREGKAGNMNFDTIKMI